MIKKEFNNLGIEVYEETLSNGLRVFLSNKKNTKGIYATLTADFGSNITEFIPSGSNDYVKVPAGIAHFLEHKMFDNNGEDVGSIFSKNGVSANANTSRFRTCYLFDGFANFEENLNLLLDYVQNPYFTDENVEKEKPIILQEMAMYDDNPYDKCIRRLFENALVSDNSRVPVIGDEASVNSITKEDLQLCYDNFYHPSNMILVITGNVDIEKTTHIIHKNQDKKDFKKYVKPIVKKIDEPDKVYKEKDEMNLSITIPKVAIAYKMNLKKLREKHNLDDKVIRTYLSMFAGFKFGSTSLFLDKVRKEQILTASIGHSVFSTDDTVLLLLDAETKNPYELIKRINEELKDLNILENDFNLRKKNIISSVIYDSENIYEINNGIINDVLETGKVVYDKFDIVKSLNYVEFKKIVNDFDFTNSAQVIVKPKCK